MGIWVKDGEGGWGGKERGGAGGGRWWLEVRMVHVVVYCSDYFLDSGCESLRWLYGCLLPSWSF